MVVLHAIDEIKLKSKIKSNDRIFILAPIEGKSAKDVSGNSDARLFTGENSLHAILDIRTCLWSLKYKSGALPGGLQQQFTSWALLKKHVTDYYKKRNIEVKEIIE
jgi:hypothetical protein